MPRSKNESAVLTLRVPAALDRRLTREARRRRKTRSEVARTLLEAGLGSGDSGVHEEARRQSILVSRRRSEREALRFVVAAADPAAWR